MLRQLHHDLEAELEYELEAGEEERGLFIPTAESELEQLLEQVDEALFVGAWRAMPLLPRNRSPRMKPGRAAASPTRSQTTAPVLSPLADFSAGLRRSPYRRRLPVYGVCVHTTGSGPARWAAKDPRKRSALARALNYYLHGGGGYPHYLIGYDGAIYGTCDERNIAAHAGWASIGGKKAWASKKLPVWWPKVWGPRGKRSPADLVPPAARSPNDVYIGVELLADTSGFGFTEAQYQSLARLVNDVARRHELSILSAPSSRLLGHEDVDPIQRTDKYGRAWDPGAHRDGPKFSWARLWGYMNPPRAP